MTYILQHRAPITGIGHSAMDFAAAGLGAVRRIGLSLNHISTALPMAIGEAFAMVYVHPFHPS